MALTQQQVDQFDVSRGFGMGKVEELQALGATRGQIIEIAARAPIIGDRAAALFPELASWGSKEKVDLGVIPGNFNWIEYVNANPDLDAAGIDTAEEAARHYALFGSKEGRPNAPAPLPSRDERYQNIRNELEFQYNNLVKLAPEAGYQGRASDLPAIFNQQAAQLADAGVTSILNLRNQNGRLVDISTGQQFTNTNLGGQIAVDRDTGATKWGDIFSGVQGGANYGISFDKEGVPIMYPVHEKSKSLAAQVFGSDLFKLVSIGLTIYGIYNLGTALASAAGVNTAAAAATTAAEAVGTEAAKAAASEVAKEVGKTAVEEALKDMAFNAALGAGIFTAAGGDPLQGAVLGALGSIGSTTYAGTVGATLAPTASAAAQITIGSAAINAGLSGMVAAATGADVTKSMLAGAAKGASIANSKTIAEAVVGKSTIDQVVNATNLTRGQVEQIIASSLSNGLIAEVAGTGQFLDVVASSLVTNGIGTSTANGIVNNINLDVAAEKGIFSATRNLASAATDAALRGEDIGKALEMAAPGAILSGYQSYEQELDRQDAAKEQQIGAVQQPIQVAGEVPTTAGPLGDALQQAIDRGERIVGQETRVDPETGQKYVSYKIQGYTRGDINSLDPQEIYDPSLFYEYEVEFMPEINSVMYSWNFQKEGQEGQLAEVNIVSSRSPPSFKETASGVVGEATGAASVAPPTASTLPSEALTPTVISEPLRENATNLLIQNELARLENELATLNAQQLTSQQALGRAQGQFERISELPTGTIDADLRGALEEELADLEDTLSQGAERAAQLEQERGAVEGIGAEGGQRLTDEQLLGYLETGDLPEGFFGRPEGEGEAPKGGLAEGGEGEGLGETGEGEGEGEGGEGEGEGGALEPEAIRTPLSPALLFSQQLPQRPETTPFASRVTGEALEGILGEKEPLFGGDEDEQRAVWNRRSLRLLSRALGL